jgi:hypothetical protein
MRQSSPIMVDPEFSERNRWRPWDAPAWHQRDQAPGCRTCRTHITSKWERNGWGVRHPASHSRVDQISWGRFHSTTQRLALCRGGALLRCERTWFPACCRGGTLLAAQDSSVLAAQDSSVLAAQDSSVLAAQDSSVYLCFRRPACRGNKLLGAI